MKNQPMNDQPENINQHCLIADSGIHRTVTEPYVLGAKVSWQSNFLRNLPTFSVT